MLFRALILRPLRQDWGRTLLTLLAVALGVAVVVAIRVANRSAVDSFARNTRSLAGGADLLATGPEPITPATLAALRPLAAYAEISPFLDRDGKLGVDFLALGQGREAAPAAASSSRLLDLPDALARFEPGSPPVFDGLRVQLAPGADASAVARRIQAVLPADTIAPPAGQVAQQAKMLDAFRFNLAALAYVAVLVAIFLIYNTVSISVVRRRTAIATLRALGATRGRIRRLFLAEAAVLSLAGGVLGLGLGWLLAAAALDLMQRTISNLYAYSPASRATLTSADPAWGLAVALAAGLVAALAPARAASGLRPAEALRPGTAERLASPLARRLTPLAVLLAAAALLAARLALRSAAGTGLWLGFLSALAAVLAFAALTPALLGALLPRLRACFLLRRRAAPGLAAASLAGALRRTSVLTVAVATAIGVLLGVGIMVGSFRQTVNLWLGQQLRDDVYVRAAAPADRDHPAVVPAPAVAALAALPGAVAVSALRTQPWSFRGQPITVNTHWAVRGPAARPAYQFLDGGPGPVLVSEPFARRFKLWSGDTFTLAAPAAPLNLRVAGVFYDYSSDRGLVVLAPPLFARGFGPPQPTDLGLDLAPAAARGADAYALLRRARAAAPAAHLQFTANADLRAGAMRVFDQTFRITYALEVIALLVAILGVGNTLLAVILERGDELALLRYLGATRGRIRAVLLAEAGLVATLALALGWGMGLVLAFILARVINVQSFGWTIAFHLPLAFCLLASAAVWLATLAAGWLPARFAPRALEAAG